MIHALSLPPKNLAHLRDIVRIQIDLLYFAISVDFVEKDVAEKKKACREFFDGGNKRNLYQDLQGRGEAIADWLWAPPSSTRHENLENFTKTCAKVRTEAGDWCHQLRSEVEALLDEDHVTIGVGDHFSYKDKHLEEKKRKKEPPHRKEYAKDFLLYFYSAYFGSSSGLEFPAHFFAQTDTSSSGKYGRKEFLDAFIACNSDLEMCPCCDENRLYIKNNKTTRTEIDHFLPKEKYPHLACHPYNLVPVCHHCNASTKSSSDPLEGRKSLSRNLFPYGITKLRYHGRLKVVNSHNAASTIRPDVLNQQLIMVPHNRPPAGEGEETPEQKEARIAEVKEAICLLNDLYGIPDRWHNMQKTHVLATDDLEQEQEARTLQVMLMSETLVRRICQFLGHSERFLGIQERIESPNTGLRGSDVAQVVYNDLKRLLYYLDHEDQGKDAFAFAMTWILAARLKEIDRGESPLVEEIVSWYLQNAAALKQRDEHVEKLLGRIEE